MSENTIDGFIMVDGCDFSNSPLSSSEEGGRLAAISNHVAEISDSLRRVSIEIHDHPELQYKEFHAHDVLTKYMREQEGWQVTPSAYAIATAFIAVFDSGKKGPVVSFNAEYEGGGGKIKLLNAGAYRDQGVDISLIAHPGVSPDAALVRTTAYASLHVEYFGKEAHAAGRPWEGINALDSLITAYNAISVLRQQTQPGDIIQAQITDGGLRPNIIHAHSAGLFVVRSRTKACLDALKQRVIACFEAGALATGARLEIRPGSSYLDNVPNHALGRIFRHFFNELGGSIREGEIDEIISAGQASTDQGNVSHALPSLHPSFWIRSEDGEGKQLGGPHTPDFEKAARIEESHELAMRVAKALAATAVEVLTDAGLLAEIKLEFKESPLI